MRVISPSTVRQWAKENPGISESLLAWLRDAKQSDWRSLMDVRKSHSSADGVKVKSGSTVTVFNIGGNKFRLITAIHYNTGRVFTLMLLSHAEYDRDNQKWRRLL
jgi:mRNA interferase HigB